MPSPFPGMDPYLEGTDWPDFHVLLIAEIHAQLVPQVRPKYVVRAERRVYVERQLAEDAGWLRPDRAVARDGAGERRKSTNAGSQGNPIEPVILTVPVPETHREAYLSIRLRETQEVISVIEVLSPANKRPQSDGQREYLEKRQTILESRTHLVELDLLRGGQRLPTIEPLPPGDYYAVVCRGGRRPLAEVYAWSLREALPPIPVPLAPPDPDAVMELGPAFHRVYDRAGYDYSLDYDRPLEPPLPEGDANWVREVLARRGGSP